MKEKEALTKLKAYIDCRTREVSGVHEECNMLSCGNCDLCYEQGTTSEHLEAIKMAIKAIEKQYNDKKEDKKELQCTNLKKVKM